MLSGKAYAKALFCLKTVCEAMERLLIEQFTVENNIQVTDATAILNIIKLPNRENLDDAIRDTSTIRLIEKYITYQDKVRNGHLGKTAHLWMSFINHSHLTFMLLHAVKTNNISLFHKCNGEMAGLFFAYGGQNYSR